MSQARAPRVAVGGFLHETHTFAQTPTTLDDFRSQLLLAGDEIVERLAGSAAGIGGMLDAARARGWELAPTLYAAAMPSGIIGGDAYIALRDELLARLGAALPVDGVLLALHGAAVAEGELDPEADILARVRALVGPITPVVVELDMHGNISPRTAELCDVLVAYDTNPHTDTYERGAECVALLARLLARAIRPTAALYAPPILLAPQATGTADLPLRAVHARAAAIEGEPGVLNVSVFGGFAYADTPWTGPSVVVTTDGDPGRAERYARELGDLLLAHRDAATIVQVPPEEAVRQAMAHPAGPVILVDSADNIGGGTPGDGTDALRAMLAAGAQEGTIVLADPAAVATCWAAGEGAQVALSVGAKTDRWHGEPVAVRGLVRRLTDGTFTCERHDHHFASTYGTHVRMGRTAWLRAGGVNIVLTELKTPPMDLAQLRSVGIIPEEQQMIVVKSAVAYRSAYLPIAAAVIEMDTAGLCTANLRRFTYRHLRQAPDTLP